MNTSALELYDFMVMARTRVLQDYERRDAAHLLVTIVAEFYIHKKLTSLALEAQYRRAIDQDVDDAEDILSNYAQHDVTLGVSPFHSHLRHQVAIILECVEQLENSETSRENPSASNQYFQLGELIHAFCNRTFPEPHYQGSTTGRRHAYMAEGRAFLLNVYHNAGITARSEVLGGIVADTCCVKLHTDGSKDRIANSIFHVYYSDSESELDSSEGNISNGNAHDDGVVNASGV